MANLVRINSIIRYNLRQRMQPELPTPHELMELSSADDLFMMRFN